MPDIDFFKYHGLGNDFILIDAIDRADLLDLPWPRLAPAWCDRHTSIGADGLLLLAPASHPASAPSSTDRPAPDIRMHIFNADGSEAQMCGNGIRCVAKHLIEHRRWPRSSLNVLTRRGVLPIACEVSDGRMIAATVDMGEPILRPADVPIRPGPNARASPPSPAHHADSAFVDQPIDLPPMDPQTQEALRRSLGPVDPRSSPETSPAPAPLSLRITAVSMGNPHAVVFCDDVAALPLDRVGPALERHPLFPEKTNAQFVQVIARDAARVRTWERGAGPTQACGTGACAVLVAAVLAGRMARHAAITLPGGDLDIRWDENTNHVLMTGPAALSYRGTINI